MDSAPQALDRQSKHREHSAPASSNRYGQRYWPAVDPHAWAPAAGPFIELVYRRAPDSWGAPRWSRSVTSNGLILGATALGGLGRELYYWYLSD